MSEPERKFWFNRSAFSAIGEYVARGEDPRLADVTGPRLWVLLAMCSFVGLGDECRADPKCFASLDAIAERAGAGKRTAGDNIPKLCAAGLIEHTGRRVTGRDGRAGPVIYRLPVLADAFAAQESRVAGAATLNARAARRVAGAATEGMAGAATEGMAGAATDTSNPREPEGIPGGDGVVAATGVAGAASAAAPGGASAAARTSRGKSASASCIAELADKDECSIEHVRAWTEWVLEGKGESVEDPDAYLWWWRKNKQGPAEWSPRVAEKSTRPRRQTAKAAKQGGDTAARSATATATAPVRITTAVRAEVVAAVVAGATPQEEADRIGWPDDVDMVERWVALDTAENGAA